MTGWPRPSKGDENCDSLTKPDIELRLDSTLKQGTGRNVSLLKTYISRTQYGLWTSVVMVGPNPSPRYLASRRHLFLQNHDNSRSELVLYHTSVRGWIPCQYKLLEKYALAMPRHPKHVPQSIPQSTFVLDNGGFSIKAGFAPTSLSLSDTQTLQNCQSIPNAIARTKEKRTLIAAQINTPTIQWNDAVFRRPVEQGQLVSWEAQKEIWDLSFFDEKTADKDMLIKQPEDTTLVLTEAPNTMPSLQKNADEIIMEEWGFGGYMRTVGG